jgi:hypothetical protein
MRGLATTAFLEVIAPVLQLNVNALHQRHNRQPQGGSCVAV